MAKCIDDNFKVILKTLCNLDHLPHGCFLNTGEQKLKIYLRIGNGFTSKDSLEVLLEPPCLTNLWAGLLDDFVNLALPLGPILLASFVAVARARFVAGYECATDPGNTVHAAQEKPNNYTSHCASLLHNNSVSRPNVSQAQC